MKNHLGLAIPPVGNGILTPSALGIMQAYGAHLYLPGVSVNEGNYVDSFGAAPLASVNDYIGYVADSLIEQQSANLVTNSEFVGAAVGVSPTGWTATYAANGITQSVVGTGSDALGSYLDIRIQGTCTSSAFPQLFSTPITSTSAVQGELFSAGCYMQLISGSVGSVNFGLRMQFFTSGPVFAEETTQAFLDSFATPTFLTASRVATIPSILYAAGRLQANISVGQTVDVTIRVWRMQFNKGRLVPYTATPVGSNYATNAIPAYQQTTGFKPQLLDSAGIKSWKGDGTDDRLNLAKPSLDFNGNCFRVLALKLPPGASPGTYVYAGAYGPTSCRGLQVYIQAGGTTLKLSMRDSSATGVDAGITRAANEKVVISGYRTPTSVDIRCRGNIVSPYALSSSTAQANWAATNERILCYSPNGADGLYCPYEVYGMITGNGSITLAELDILETYLASIAGIIFVP